MIGLHLSRLSEDLIIWSTTEFGFLEFSDSFSTHSSLMPQKKNPDMGRLYGNLMSILTTMKALPFSYNRDIQEDKRALFDSIDTIKSALDVFAAMLPELKINRERMNSSARDPNLFATDLAEYLVKKRVPFREAHQIVGELVVRSFAKSIPLDQIGIAEMKKFSPHFEDDVAKIFDVRGSLAQLARDRRSVT
jgi:argininosuccinate lyase